MILPGLPRITSLLTPLFLSHPPGQLPWRAIHIAGTNGKGSVAALISTFLLHQGYSVGRFTSPHLIDRWDCISINREIVDRERFIVVERRFKERSVTEGIGASEFEILTASAFQLFTDAEVDVAVVECGMGGGKDATNVLRNGDVVVSVVTKVGLDHVEFLGGTIGEIAREKVGIFKGGESAVVVDGSNEKEVLEVVEEGVGEVGGGKKVYVSEEERGEEFGRLAERMGLAETQRQNLYTAWSAMKCAGERLSPPRERKGKSLSPEDPIQSSLEQLILDAQASLPGRLQWLDLPAQFLSEDISQRHSTSQTKQQSTSNPPIGIKILLDGAHNTQSSQGLASYTSKHLRTHNPQSSSSSSSSSSSALVPQQKPITFLLAMKSDKDISQILSILLKPHDNVLTCAFGPVDGMPWVKPLPPAILAEEARSFTDGVVEAVSFKEKDEEEAISSQVLSSGDTGDQVRNAYVARALRKAVRIAIRQIESHGDEEPRLCIAGSLYLVGDVLRCVRNAGGKIYG